eukprot:13076608-Alexandrium_andersonii.AAC.1
MPALWKSHVQAVRCHCCWEIPERLARARTTSRSHVPSSRSSPSCPVMPTSPRIARAGSSARSHPS